MGQQVRRPGHGAERERRPGAEKPWRRRLRVHDDGVHPHAEHVVELPRRVPGADADDPAPQDVRGHVGGERLRRHLGPDGDRPAGAQPGLAQRVRQPPDQLQQLAACDGPGSVLERRRRGGGPQRVEQGGREEHARLLITTVAYCPMPSYNGIHIRGGSETSLT